jgi:hypothetical protein
MIHAKSRNRGRPSHGEVIREGALDRKRDCWVGLVLPLMPLYYVYMHAASAVAVTEELLTRRSFRDNFVPERVRRETWHW